MFKKTIIAGCEERGDYNEPYLTRYTILETKRFQVCIHYFHRSDSSEFHDHPWRFLSIILWRGYFEETHAGKKRVWPGMFLFRNAIHQHRVELVKGRPAVTLVIMGRKKRMWGFITPSGWENYIRYFKRRGCN